MEEQWQQYRTPQQVQSAMVKLNTWHSYAWMEFLLHTLTEVVMVTKQLQVSTDHILEMCNFVLFNAIHPCMVPLITYIASYFV